MAARALNVRKATLTRLLRRAAPGLRLNEHLEEDGPMKFIRAGVSGQPPNGSVVGRSSLMLQNEI
jgi:hypothetical protein